MSTTYIANIVAFLTLVLPKMGVQVVDPASLAGAISSVIGVASVLYVFYGRYKAGGITALGLKVG